MSRCDRCGNEVVLPFSCQYCGGKYCADCRLPPNHDCVNITLWNSKPLPSVGISYGKGGRATPTGGGETPGPRQAGNKKPDRRRPETISRTLRYSLPLLS